MCVVCASARWFITINTMIGFMRRNLLAKSGIRWYIFHAYAMFSFLTNRVILETDHSVLVYRRNPDNVPCFGTIFKGMSYCQPSVPKLIEVPWFHISWWRHQIETFSVFLALCAGNSPVTGEFPSQRPMTRSFGVFFYLRLNKQLSKQSRHRWFETPSRSLLRHCNVNVSLASRTLAEISINCMDRCLPISDYFTKFLTIQGGHSYKKVTQFDKINMELTMHISLTNACFKENVSIPTFKKTQNSHGISQNGDWQFWKRWVNAILKKADMKKLKQSRMCRVCSDQEELWTTWGKVNQLKPRVFRFWRSVILILPTCNFMKIGCDLVMLNTLRPRQNGRHLGDDIFTNENHCILMLISLKFVSTGQINNHPKSGRIIAWCRTGDKPLSKPSLVTHIWVTWLRRFTVKSLIKAAL